MTSFIFCRLIWDRRALPFRMPGTRHHDLHLAPSADAPFGRKGKAMLAAWKQLREPDCAGLLVLDGDVAVDVGDYAAMGEAIAADPGTVHVGPAKLWPQSTMKETWSWAHWDEGHGLTQDWTDTPDRWSFCFTYMPRQLLRYAELEGMARWQFPNVDKNMNAVALRHRVPARVVPGCYPKHMHY